MKTFKVTYRETIWHEFYVDAETKEDVEDEFYKKANCCELDFSDGEVVGGEIVKIEEV